MICQAACIIVAPIDTNDTPTASLGDDNNGNVDGTAATKAGLLSIPDNAPFTCQPYTKSGVSGVSCTSDANGDVTVDFTVTMQPGDNFTVAASQDLDYLVNLMPTSDGINLRDPNSIQIPAAKNGSNDCLVTTVNACRTDMLTVWRRLHIEVDSMDRAHENYVRGENSQAISLNPGQTVTRTVSNTDLEVNRFEKGRIEFAAITSVLDVISNTASSVTVKNSTASNIVLANNVDFELLSANGGNSAIGTIPTGQTIAPNQTVVLNISGTPLTVDFSSGSMFITPVLQSLSVISNTASSVSLKNNGTGAITVANGTHFRLYDDDDYNDDNGTVKQGDETESIVQFSNSFRHLQSTDGDYPDLTPQNVLGVAYIRPDRSWAAQFDGNLPFDLNVSDAESNANSPSSLINANRGSKNSERDDFWIAYVILAYQPGNPSDLDPTLSEPSEVGVAPAIACDCYQSSNCPRPLSACTAFPTGGPASLVFLETSQDLRKLWLDPPLPFMPKVFNEAETTVPHELGHQLGLKGDQLSTDFLIMDYQDPQTSSGNVFVGFHPEHINILRKRVHSPD